ncbi:hypothetical protein OAM04_03575, partial [bacterium]|nr:hypothetical protein [bacterium]
MIMELERFDLSQGAGVQYGSNVLRSLLANDMPGVDLLVREAIQNSLDANSSVSDSVKVEFTFEDFNLNRLEGLLDNATVKRISTLFGSASNRSLCYRDSGTVGLSGAGRFDELPEDAQELGNFLKLVSSIGLPQEQEGAGGSWGYGKTVFFRVSRVPVMYYSRFRDGADFRERLVFALIEDQTNREKSILLNRTGFAWWGVGNDGKCIFPCEDRVRISGILDRLGIAPFIGDETGTVIFMPCLAEGQVPRADPEDRTPPWWVSRDGESNSDLLADYTQVAIQRWYSPRLQNDGFPRPPLLTAFVNDDEVGAEENLPLFEIIRDLHRVGEGKQPVSAE